MNSSSLPVSTSSSSLQRPWRSLGLLLMAALVVTAGWAVRADASASCTPQQICVYDPCASPASPVPAQFWGELQPADTTFPLDVSAATATTTARDMTSFAEYTGLYSSNPYYYGIDIQNNWVFTAMSYGVKVWNLAGSTNGLPTFVSYLPFSAFPFWPEGNEPKIVIQDISLPAGVDTIGAVTGVAGVGLAIVDFTNKSMPFVRYQHGGISDATSVYAAKIGGTNYAFAASPTGLRVYNMDAAVSHNYIGCVESSPGAHCPGVFVGQIGTSFASYVAGIDNYLVVSTGSGAGFDLWDVTNPAAPVHKLSNLTNATVFGVAMWKDTSGNYYVGARSGPFFGNPNAPYQLSILNATCVASGCATLPTVSVTPDNSAVAAGTTQSYYLTFSRESDGTPFLYLGSDENCGNPIAQREYLLDVVNPAAPRDITPTHTALYAGAGGQNYQVGYWGWYYQKNPTGFNLVAPRKGKFAGQYFYRVAATLFDVHQRVGATAPTAAFSWSPQQIYPGTPVTFTDQSSGAPTSWSWSFQPDGSPSSATVQNPSGITFASAGSKTVALTAGNTQGSNGTNQTVTVLNPQPEIGSLSVSPASPLQCQPVTLTANTVTGAPPLTYAWNITNSDSVTAPGGTSSATTFLWDTGANSVPAGSYTATLTVSGTGAPAVMTTPVTLAALQALPISFTPTNDAFVSATVQFHAGVAGATSWNWNFGDGAGFTGWTSDPTNGPNPTHTYSAVNNYAVQVMVRNCLTPTTVTSGTLNVNVTQVTPLVANFGPVCAFAPCAFGVGTAITFVDHSTGATFWDYDWNGTGTFSDAGHTAPVTSHTYTVAGNYSPALRVRRGTEEQNVFTVSPPINVSPAVITPPPPNPVITVSGPSTGAVNTPYTFTGLASNCTPAATWTWIVGTGGTVSGSTTAASITVTWATTGNFSLAASNTGCSGALGSKAITISPTGSGNPGTGLTSSFVFSPTSPNAGQSVSFDGTGSKGSPTGYQWFFGDGTNGTGAVVTHIYAAQGPYTVKLDVTGPGSGVNCFSGICTVESSQTIVVNNSSGTPPPPPLNSDFSSSAGACSNVGGFAFCPAVAGTAATLTAVETRATSYVWNFGDGSTGTGATVTHTWNNAESYSVSLTLSAAGFASASTTKTFQVTAPPAPTFQSLVLPWVAETRGALVQSCDLYLHNPGADPLDVTLQFLKRGTPQNPPPQATATIDPGATMFVSDVLQNLFQQDNIAGFVTVTVKATDPLPIITSFNTVVAASGTQFGQTVPGLPLPNANPPATTASGPSEFTLIGLNDNASELAYFGLTNPTSSTATYNIQLFDNTGAQIGGSSTALTLGPFGQRQFQESDIQNLFGLSSGTDYRVEVQDMAGGTLIPYGENVRLGSGAPTFITSGATNAATQYVIGAYSTAGAWQSDVVLANTSTQPMNLSLTFTRLGVTAPSTAPVALTLNPGQTQRLSNAIASEWNLNNTVGVITVSSNAASGPYPIVQAESYNNAQPANRFGQSMMAFSDADAAGTGQSDYLVGLRQDGKNFVTTFWVFNPSATDFAVYDVVYLALDGSVLGTVSDVSLPPGKVRQFLPAQHPIPAAGVINGFTVQVKVKAGKALAAAQVLTTSTGAPAYVQGAAE
jgi:PKD repeat protein